MPKIAAPPKKTPSRSAVLRAVVSSTAVETGQTIPQLERSLQQAKLRFSHIKLAR